MATQVQNRRGTTAEHSTFTGAAGEITVDTDKEVAVVHDGSTAGGYPLMRENGSNSALALGSAGTPSLKFTGDTNTGIYSPGADQLAVATNGTRRLLIDSAGALTLDTGDATIYGVRVGRGNSARADNTAVGKNALNANTTGDYNVAVGSLALQSNQGGISNVAVGLSALAANVSANSNTGVGTEALLNNTGGSNTCIGSTAGKSLTTGSNNTIIGEITGTAGLANTVIIGAGSIERLRIDSSGRVGIGTSSPVYLVDAQGGRALFSDSSSTFSVGVRNRASLAPNGNFWIGATNAVSPDMVFSNNSGNERMRITDAGLVGIGTTSPSDALQVANGNILIGTGGSSAGYRALYFGSSSTASARFAYIEKNNDSPYDFNIVAQSSTTAASAINFKTTPINTAATIDSSGRLLVGTSSSSATGRLFVQANTGDSAGAGVLHLQRGEAATSITTGEQLGLIYFADNSGNTFARIDCEADGTAGTNDYPGRLVFSTTADGASSPTERMRIANNGQLSAVVPGNSTLYPGFMARAWVNFNGTGTPAIRASGNVSSITDNGVGDYTVNFTTAMPNADYSVASNSSDGESAGSLNRSVAITRVRASSTVRISCQGFATTDYVDPTFLSVAIFR